MNIIAMFGKREFLENSSSSEDISTNQSNPTNRSSDVHETAPSRVVPKPPAFRPISANARILSIQRAKLLNRGKDSARVETSPFFRSTAASCQDCQPESFSCKDQVCDSSKTQAKVVQMQKVDWKSRDEEIEEIKIIESVQVKEKTPIRRFLRPESPERIDPSIIRSESRNNELTPEPRYQRVTVQPNRGIRERPSSHACERKQSDFKTVTTVSSKRLSNTSLSISPDFKTSSFLPVPQGSSLNIVLTRAQNDVSKKTLEFSVKLLSTGLFMFACRRRKSGNFLFSLKEDDFSKKSENFLGRVSNKNKEFRFFDFGTKAKTGEKGRKQFGTCVYVKNSQEKNSFFVVVPKVVNNQIVELRPKLVECNFGQPVSEKFYQKVIKATGILFSKKNFVVTDEKGIGDYVKMEKTRSKTFRIAVFSPFSPFQAVCIALTRFEKSLKE